MNAPAPNTRSRSFGTRLESVFAGAGRLCVGIDPHAYLLSRWGISDSASGASEFGMRIVEAAVGRVGIVKPQVAFFERFGSTGIAALERVLGAAREAGLLVIADVKRCDVGSTLEAYANAWLAPGSPLEADAVTVSAYLGVGSLESAFSVARSNSKGIFVLAASSNPDGKRIQQAVVGTSCDRTLTVARAIMDEVIAADTTTDSRIGSLGVVLGATLDLESFGIQTHNQPARLPPILAPGFGRQGAHIPRTRAIFGNLSPGVIVSESRSVLEHGPEGISDAITRSATEVAIAID